MLQHPVRCQPQPSFPIASLATSSMTLCARHPDPSQRCPKRLLFIFTFTFPLLLYLLPLLPFPTSQKKCQQTSKVQDREGPWVHSELASSLQRSGRLLGLSQLQGPIYKLRKIITTSYDICENKSDKQAECWCKVFSKMILEYRNEDEKCYALIKEEILESQGCFVKKVRLKLLLET